MEKYNLTNRQFSSPRKRNKKIIKSSKTYLQLPNLMTKKRKIDEANSEQLSSQLKRSVQETFIYSDKNNITSVNNIDSIKKNYGRKETFSPRKKKSNLKKNNNFEEYFEKLYEDEDNFKKNLFKKTNPKNNNKKVVFLKPYDNINSINNFKINENSIISPKSCFSSKFYNDKKDDKKSNGCNIKLNKNLFKSTIDAGFLRNCLFNKDYDKRTKRSKETYNSFKYINRSNIGNSDKNIINKTLIQFSKDKKINSSKLNAKLFRKEISKLIKDKEKNSINRINKSDKKIKKKKLLIYKINDKIINNNDKKDPNLFPNKSIENAETLVLEEQNKKKRKKQFCCPFLLCLKMSEDEEN